MKETKIANAYWIAPARGIALLSENWTRDEPPPLSICSPDRKLVNLQRGPTEIHAEICGFYVEDGQVTFVVFEDDYPLYNFEELGLYVAGDFNKWGNENRGHWQMQRACYEDRCIYVLRVSAAKVFKGDQKILFKFVTGDWHWLNPNYHAPNLEVQKGGVCNYRINPKKTGDHFFMFDVEGPRAISGNHSLIWQENGTREEAPINASFYFYQLASDHPQGAHIDGDTTTFRLFAPRALKATVEYFTKADESDLRTLDMTMLDDGMTWQATVESNLNGAYYFYRVDGRDIGSATHFDPSQRIVDPWALATAAYNGPGIIIDRSRLPKVDKPFTPPQWQDLVILETHVRDLIKHAPVDLTPDERLGFAGLRKWVEHKGGYLTELGVNCIELQPIQQNDAQTHDEYHWGYMTTNYFSPTSHYASKPMQASQIEEFHELVKAFHGQGLAVILDVVYNHTGEPNFLLYVDKQYYFDITPDGDLINWSGTGNTLRADAAMAKRLIIESLTHLIEVYDIDGFRFDLAELLGINVLHDIRIALQKVKPGVILIAEPWSFRGHIARDLRHSGWMFWNDSFREFAVRYLKGKGNSEGIRYHMSGCLSYLTGFPSQSVNYVESHDDRAFLDKITENANHNGFHPTDRDRHRCHLMIGILMCSLGTPMLSAGQDFMRSKHGKNNTYLDGDENALDYNRINDFRHTHDYFRKWIAFRNGEFGKVFRLYSLPGDGYTRYWSPPGSAAVAAWWNPDSRNGPAQVLFTINPHPSNSVRIHCDGLDADGWLMVADRHHFNMDGVGYTKLDTGSATVEVEAIGLCLFIKKVNPGEARKTPAPAALPNSPAPEPAPKPEPQSTTQAPQATAPAEPETTTVQKQSEPSVSESAQPEPRIEAEPPPRPKKGFTRFLKEFFGKDS